MNQISSNFTWIQIEIVFRTKEKIVAALLLLNVMCYSKQTRYTIYLLACKREIRHKSALNSVQCTNVFWQNFWNTKCCRIRKLSFCISSFVRSISTLKRKVDKLDSQRVALWWFCISIKPGLIHSCSFGIPSIFPFYYAPPFSGFNQY